MSAMGKAAVKLEALAKALREEIVEGLKNEDKIDEYEVYRVIERSLNEILQNNSLPINIRTDRSFGISFKCEVYDIAKVSGLIDKNSVQSEEYKKLVKAVEELQWILGLRLTGIKEAYDRGGKEISEREIKREVGEMIFGVVAVIGAAAALTGAIALAVLLFAPPVAIAAAAAVGVSATAGITIGGTTLSLGAAAGSLTAVGVVVRAIGLKGKHEFRDQNEFRNELSYMQNEVNQFAKNAEGLVKACAKLKKQHEESNERKN